MAVGIVFIHNTLPHQHHKALDDVSHTEEVSEANNLLEMLQLGFHLDIGSDHLANFEKSEKVSFSPPFFIDLVAPYNFGPRSVEELRLSDFKHIKGFTVLQPYWNEISFRGPPTA